MTFAPGLASIRPLLLLGLAAWACGSPAVALEWVGSSLPTFAQGSPAAAVNAYDAAPFARSWDVSGLTSNSSVMRLNDRLLLGVTTASGPSSLAFGRAPGFDFSSTNVKLGYDLGRFTPFITSSITSSKLSAPAGMPTAFNTTGDLLAGRTDRSSASIGAGFNYAVTDSIHFGMSASVNSGRPASPFGW